MARPKKDKWADMPEEFKVDIEEMDETAIRSRIAQVALNQAELMAAKILDDDLTSKREAAKEAGAVYREGTKLNKLKIEYCKEVLDGRGSDVSDDDELDE